MPVILLYGIYGGVTTPTEAAAVAAAYALVLAAFFYRSLSLRSLRTIMLDSVKSSASVGLVIGGALILNYIVASENIPKLLADQMLGMEISPMAFMLGVNLLLLLLGCILDATTIILVIIPLFVVSARALGIDLVHFGVVVVVNCMIGLITPPYGVLLFVINGTTGIPLIEIIREIVPFLIALLFALAMLIFFPATGAVDADDVRLRGLTLADAAIRFGSPIVLLRPVSKRWSCRRTRRAMSATSVADSLGPGLRTMADAMAPRCTIRCLRTARPMPVCCS